MLYPECSQNLSRRSRPALRDIFQPLADALSHIYFRGKIEQPLISGSILDYGFSFSVHRQNNWPLGSLQLPHHLHGIIAEGGKRLNVFLDVEHERSSPYRYFNVPARSLSGIDSAEAPNITTFPKGVWG